MKPQDVLLKIKAAVQQTVQQSANVSDFVAIDFSNDHVKLVHVVEVGGKKMVKNVLHKKFKENSDDEICRYLASTYKELNVKPKKTICVISSTLFISKNVDMPSRDREEISKIIDLQAGRYTPYSRDEIIIDYLCMEVPDQHYTNVFLVIVHRKVIERYFQICDRAKIEIDQMVVLPEGLALQSERIADIGFQHEPVCGIHMDWESSDLVVADRGQMVFVRAIPVGAKQFESNRESGKLEFMKELNKTLLAYQNQGVGRPIKCLAVTGLVKGFDSIEKELKEAVPYLYASNVPIKVVPYSKYFDYAETVPIVLDSETQISFFEIIACLFTLPSLTLDLSTKEVRLKRRFRESGKEMMTLGILIMSIFFVFSCYLAAKIYLKGVEMQKLDRENEITFEQSRKIESVSTKTRALKEMVIKRETPLYVFDRITSLIGDDIYLSNFSYDDEGNIRLTGTAESMSRVFAFVTTLEESKYFQSVKKNETKSRREGQAEVADFDIGCVLANEA
jgi:hypothetical protein